MSLIKAVFISDLHLKPEGDTKRSAELVRFLQALRGRCEHIFILGDLFDFYLEIPEGEYLFDEYRKVFDALADLNRLGTHILYLEGNHDFRFGRFISQGVGAEIVTEDAEILLDGYSCYMAHGDQVNRKDVGYLRLRSFLRGGFVSFCLRNLPPHWIYGIGNYFSKKSRVYTAEKNDNLDEIYRQFAADRWNDGYDVVVLGHNHKQDHHEAVVGGRRRLYLNLGVWTQEKMPFLELTTEGFVFRDVRSWLKSDGETEPDNIRRLHSKRAAK